MMASGDNMIFHGGGPDHLPPSLDPRMCRMVCGLNDSNNSA